MLFGNTIFYDMDSLEGINFKNELLFIYRNDDLGTW